MNMFDKPRLKILMITSRLPFPLDKGDKLRAYYQLLALRQKYDVHLMSIVDSDTSLSDAFHLREELTSCHVLRITSWQRFISMFKALWSNLPFQVAWFYSNEVKKYVSAQMVEIQPDVIICQLARTALYLPKTNAFKVLDYMDAFGVGMARRSTISKGFIKWLYNLESKRMIEYETKISSQFDKLTVISEQDKGKIIVSPEKEIQVVPNGIHEKFFEHRKLDKCYDVAFVGNLSYLPNIEAVEYLVNDILPLLPASTTCVIAGMNPNNRVLKLATSSTTIIPNVEDIRDIYAQGKVFCAPLWSGTGQQNKILEAMAVGLPCITTATVNQAIGATKEREILIAENPKEFAQGIQRLLNDNMLSESMVEEARLYARSTFQWETMANKIIEKI
jgi:glycosyltransferase involved in cell wall biosynthesis